MEKEEWKNRIKKAGPVRLGLVVVCGVLLILVSGVFPGKEENGSVETAQTSLSGSSDGQEELLQYRERLKKELSAVLERVEGVGNAEVMLTLRASKEKITLKDNKSCEGEAEEETVLIEEDSHGSTPYVVQEREPELEGVVVVCEGGDNATVKKEITEAVSALFAIDSHKIKIMKSKEAKE